MTHTLHAVVGIDVSTDTLAVVLLTEPNQTHPLTTSVPNTPEGYQRLHEWCQQHLEMQCPERIAWAVECTGGLEQTVARFGHEQGYRVYLLNPKGVYALGKASPRRAKTDQSDAVLIARYVWVHTDLPCWHPPAEEIAELQAWMRRREELVARRQQLRAQKRWAQRRGLPAAVVSSYERELAAVEAELRLVERAVRAWLRSHPAWGDLVRRWQTVPGVGIWTACVVLSEVGDFSRFGDGRSLASYMGLVPYVSQSGRRSGGGCGLVAEGNRRLRSGLYLAGWAAVRAGGVYGEVYARLVGGGKCHLVAICAVARRLVMVLYALWRDGTEWREDVVRYKMSA